MKRIAPILMLCAFAARGTVIDRIAVSVGNRAITVSDIDREIRVAAFLNGDTPDFSPTERRRAADRMVEQTLVRLEMESNRYPTPSAAEVQPALDRFKTRHYPDDASYRRALIEDGIADSDVLQELIWQRTLLSYIDVRFRPMVQVTGPEIEDYFRKVVKPSAEAAHPGQSATLDEYRDRIEDTLAGKKEDDELSRWLEQAKKRTQIVYHDEAFK